MFLLVLIGYFIAFFIETHLNVKMKKKTQKRQKIFLSQVEDIKYFEHLY